jgi:integrase
LVSTKKILVMPLTDSRIRKEKTKDRIVKLSDGGGLQLWLMPNGSKLWRLAYRFEGKQKLMAIGPYPLISLASAREARDNAKRQLRGGADPVRYRLHAQAGNYTLGNLLDDYLNKLRRENRAEATLHKNAWLFSFLPPDLCGQPLQLVTTSDVLRALRKLEARGTLETANRLRSVLGSAFRYAVANDRVDRDITAALKGALAQPQVKHRAAVTTPENVGELIRAVRGFSGQPTTRLGLLLLAYLFPRPGELRGAKWTEFDIKAAVWNIPAERTKMRREHRVPLSRQALGILETLKTIIGHGPLLLPSLRSAQRPISENTLNAALRRLGYSSEEATSHGFRATASTLLGESNRWSVDAIERQLAHIESNSARKAYARGEHWEERVQMMQWWADYLDELAKDRVR